MSRLSRNRRHLWMCWDVWQRWRMTKNLLSAEEKAAIPWRLHVNWSDNLKFQTAPCGRQSTLTHQLVLTGFHQVCRISTPKGGIRAGEPREINPWSMWRLLRHKAMNHCWWRAGERSQERAETLREPSKVLRTFNHSRMHRRAERNPTEAT